MSRSTSQRPVIRSPPAQGRVTAPAKANSTHPAAYVDQTRSEALAGADRRTPLTRRAKAGVAAPSRRLGEPARIARHGTRVPCAPAQCSGGAADVSRAPLAVHRF